MKTKNLFGILVLFLATINFVGCRKNEDINKIHLQLSKNICEVMQLRTEFIYMNANENITLEVTAPELIDAVYKWKSNEGFMAVIEITGKQKGETTIVVTDNVTGESATIKVTVSEYPMPRLAVKQQKGNIFDTMEFYLHNESSEPVFAELSEICDLMVWTVEGEKGNFRVFEHKPNNEHHIYMEWGHCFLFPGEYKTYLTGWKNDMEIYRDQLDITITDDKDFLLFNWKDIKETSNISMTYVDVIGNNPDLMTAYDFIETVPSAEVRVWNSNTPSTSYDILYSYFSELYSEPTYISGDGSKMFQLYDELFSEQKKYPGWYPWAIWVTEHANFVLLMDDWDSTSKYLVYAEPANSSDSSN